MIAIIDSGGANIASVRFALERLGVAAELTADPAVIAGAERVILPGVGAAPAAMAQLGSAGLVECIRGLTQPVLGICLGMLTVPHMGWNRLNPPDGAAGHPLLDGIEPGAHVYFVHGYAAPVSENTVAACSYGMDFTALVAHGNFMGAQFHPERSGPIGARILQNFVSLPAKGN
jgi:glutamine amidotransferase